MITNSTSIKRLFAFVWPFILRQCWKFFFIFAVTMAGPIDSVVSPYLLRLIIDSLTQFENDRMEVWAALARPVMGMVGLWLFVEFCFRSRMFLRAKALPKLEADIRMHMFDHVQRHSPKYFNEHFPGSLSNKITDMTSQISAMFYDLLTFAFTLTSAILVVIFFYKISPLFSLILGVWITLHLSICFLFTAKCVRLANSHGEARSLLTGKIVDSFTNNFAVNLFYRFSFELKRLFTYQKDEQNKNFKTQHFIAWMFALLSLLYLVSIVTLTGFIITRWMDNLITTGEVVQVFNTTFNVLYMLWMTSDLLPQFFVAAGIATQALTVMQDPQDVGDLPNAKPLHVSKGEIAFENVSFRYGDRKLFEKKQVHIRGGEKVGLVGYSGAGKSSFVNLILRFYSLNEGKILIDGQDISTCTLSSLRSQISLIPQDTLLFHRTINDNIHYGNVKADQQLVYQSAKMAYCDEFIKKTPHGYDSLVGDRGTMLSGGERQRIAIARAILAAPPIIILDEATSSLDSVTEKYIQESLESLMEKRTTIVIAHRLSTLAKMDRILVFDEGKIIEEGTHETLLAKKGYYAHMWQMQAGGFLPTNPDSFTKGD